MESDTDVRSSRRRGPLKKLDTARYQVMLEPDVAEWAKAQSGGLSELVRRLLKEEKARQEADRNA